MAAPLVTQPSPAPHGVWLSAAFFAVSGVLEIALALHDAPTPLPFTAAWQAAGAGLLHFLVAWGLWRRIAVCRSVGDAWACAEPMDDPATPNASTVNTAILASRGTRTA